MKELVELEEQMLTYKGKRLPDELLIQAKKDGFCGQVSGQILGHAGDRDPRADVWRWA